MKPDTSGGTYDWGPMYDFDWRPNGQRQPKQKKIKSFLIKRNLSQTRNLISIDNKGIGKIIDITEEEEEEVNVDGPEPMDVDEFVGQVELEEYDDHHFEIQVNENVTTVKFKCMDGRGCEVLVLGGEVLLRFL